MIKDEFLDFLDALMTANPELTAKLKTENVAAYIDTIRNGGDPAKETMTKNGLAVLTYLQSITTPLKSKDIALGMGVGAKSVTGTLRKLSTDGYVEKVASPGASAVYLITDKGKNFKLN